MLRDRNLELDNECIFDKCKFTLSEIVEFIIWLNKIIVHNRRMRFYDCKGGCYQYIRKGDEWFCISKFLSESVISNMAPKNIRTLIDMLYFSPTLNYGGEFDSFENLINVQNGVVDSVTGKLIPHDAKYYFTSCLNASYIENPSIYDAPAYRHFCKTSLGDIPQKIKLSRQILGYVCSSYTKVKKAFAIIGEKNSGKSKYLELTEMIIGEDNVCNVDLDKLGNRFNVAEFSRNKVNISAELSLEPMRDPTMFKKLVGGDRVQAEDKGQNPFKFKNKCKFLFGGNGLPSLKSQDTSQAFLSRLVLLYFPDEIPESERDPDLDKKLYEERNIIFSLAVRELPELISNNFIFEMPNDEQKYLKAYSDETNQIQNFIAERCRMSPDAVCRTSTLYDAYKDYCKDNCLFAHSMTAFSKAIACVKDIEHHRLTVRGVRYRGFKGIDLNTDFLNEQDSESEYNFIKNSEKPVPSDRTGRRKFFG